MKFSSTYFKRASDNSLQQQAQSKNPDKIKEKIVEKPDDRKDGNAALRKKFQKKHGRSNSEIDYDKVARVGKSGGSSIYDLLNNRGTEQTQQTQANPMNENYAITIPTEVEEEPGRQRKNVRLSSRSPVEVISFLNPNEKHHPQNSSGDSHFLAALSDRTRPQHTSLAGGGASLLVRHAGKDGFPGPQPGEFVALHARSRSMQITPLLNESVGHTGDTMQVVYTPSEVGQKEKTESEKAEKVNENLERSVVNCLICFDKIPDAVFMECGHGGWAFLFFLWLSNLGKGSATSVLWSCGRIRASVFCVDT